MSNPEIYKEMKETSRRISTEVIEEKLKNLDIFNELHNSEKVYNKLDEILEQLKIISTNLIEINLQQITPVNHKFYQPMGNYIMDQNTNAPAQSQSQATKPVKQKKQETPFIPTISTNDIVVNTRRNRTTTISNDINESINKLNNIK